MCTAIPAQPGRREADINTRLIIVGTTVQPAARVAADWALDEATRTGATVHLLYTYECPPYPDNAMPPGGGSWRL